MRDLKSKLETWSFDYDNFLLKILIFDKKNDLEIGYFESKTTYWNLKNNYFLAKCRISATFYGFRQPFYEHPSKWWRSIELSIDENF